ncbi:hypothetical protein Lesp02_84040 [Lentzea sp. NBRC 105346]|uniref:hypothetical protein n=1 Tax=Lentzea sp. NBRC 105346 TaxID=3032205 RepID=UPI0024A3C999|nr:hypothetical protein [Lentzea sp. NBRC 105346]GLZ36217.1 hypothetical protein Lesp02_84040 [Lentzea sp. NBRC 105346]
MPLTRGNYPVTNPQWTLAGKPSGLNRQNLPREDCVTDLDTALTTQVMLSAALHLEAGDIVTNLTFKSGATAANTPTNWWFALYDDSATPALLSQSADQLTAAWAANTVKTLALATPQLISRPGIYYAAIMVKATTVPSLVGVATFAGASAGWLSGDKTLAQTSGAALTTTAPATIATPTAKAFVPRVVAT